MKKHDFMQKRKKRRRREGKGREEKVLGILVIYWFVKGFTVPMEKAQKIDGEGKYLRFCVPRPRIVPSKGFDMEVLTKVTDSLYSRILGS